MEIKARRRTVDVHRRLNYVNGVFCPVVPADKQEIKKAEDE